ncbi:hypothetical protein KAJ27_15775, partial [bacterium]|nr:hypothetical protein [bacterium]
QKVCPDKTSIRKIFVNIGPGNFSSLRVVIISALGLIKGLNLPSSKLQGFSALDVFASNHLKSEKFSVCVSDNRGGFVGSTYVGNPEFDIINPMFRLSSEEAEQNPDSFSIFEDFKNLDHEKIIEYIYSENFKPRDIMSPIYYQTSYFEK